MLILLLAALAQTAAAPASEAAARQNYRTESIKGCVASARRAAGPKAKGDPTRLCVCVTDRLIETNTMEDLNKQQAPANLKQIAAECVKASGAHMRPPAHK